MHHGEEIKNKGVVMKIINNRLPLFYRTRVHVGSQNLVFLGFTAGGSEEEVEAGECLCERSDGDLVRFTLEDLELGWRR